MFFLLTMFSQYPTTGHCTTTTTLSGRADIIKAGCACLFVLCVPNTTAPSLYYIYSVEMLCRECRYCDHGGEYRLSGPLFRPSVAGGGPTPPCQVSVLCMHGRVIAVMAR